MALVRVELPSAEDRLKLSKEDNDFLDEMQKKHGIHKDTGFFDKPEKPAWDLGDDMDTPPPTSFDSPSFKEKATSMAYGFNKGLGKTVDSVAAAGNAIYGGIAEGVGYLADSDTARNEASKAYSDANKLWNGKFAEQYVEDNKPEAIDKYANTDQKHVIDNWVSSGHTVESLVEMSGGGAVLKLGGKGIAALVSNPTAKNFLVNNKVTNWLNTFLTVPINPTMVSSAAVGGYLANDFRSKDEFVRANTPIEDTARTIGGYIAGDVTVRGGAGIITGTTKYVLKSTLPKTMYNNLVKTAENLSAEYKEPFVKALYKGLDATQETVGNWVNGMVFKANTPTGKLTMKRVREIEQAAKESIEYISDTDVLGKIQSSFGAWVLNKKGSNIDMDFLEAISPELKTMFETGGDKKTILKELSKNKDLLNAYTILKNNQKALDIALYLPEYTLQEKVLKNTDKAVMEKLKQSTYDYFKNSAENTYTNKIEDFKNLLPEFNKVLSKERDLNHEYYREILNNNPNSVIGLEEFLPEMKKLTDEFKIFAPSKTDSVTDVAAIEQISADLNNIYQSAISAESRNVGGNMVKNAIDPISLLNKRQVLNDLSYRGNSNVEILHQKAISLIDRILEKNTAIGNLPEEFLPNYRRALDFDSKIYFTHTQDEIIKTLTQGEPTGYINNIMNTSRGVEQVRKSLSKTTEEYKKFHSEIDFANKNKQDVDNYFQKIMFAYKRGKNKSNLLTSEKDGYEVGEVFYETSAKKADVISFPTKKEVVEARKFKNDGDVGALEKLSNKYKLGVLENKEVIGKLDGKAKELFDSLCQIKLKKLIFDDFINYEKTGGNFDFNTFKTQSTILQDENLIRSLFRDEKKSDFVIKKLPIILNKVGELKDKLKTTTNKSNDMLSKLSFTGLKAGGAYAIGNLVGLGPVGGLAAGATAQLTWNWIKRGVANSFDKPETTLKLIGLVEKGDDKKVLKFLLKQANVYSYNIIKNDVGGSKEYLKDKGKETKDWLLEPQTVPWNER